MSSGSVPHMWEIPWEILIFWVAVYLPCFFAVGGCFHELVGMEIPCIFTLNNSLAVLGMLMKSPCVFFRVGRILFALASLPTFRKVCLHVFFLRIYPGLTQIFPISWFVRLFPFLSTFSSHVFSPFLPISACFLYMCSMFVPRFVHMFQL